MQEDDLMSDFPFAFDSSLSEAVPKNEKPASSTHDSSSDSEFDMVCTPRRPSKASAPVSEAQKTSAIVQVTPNEKKDKDSREGDSDSVTDGIAVNDVAEDPASQATQSEAGKQAFETPKVKGAAPWRPKRFCEYPHLLAQRQERWNSLSAKDLVWYHGFPALVVPRSMYMLVPREASAGPGGVLMYGPCPKEERPKPDKRYVIVQFLPLVSDRNNPSCKFAIARGCGVERVLPYNLQTRSSEKGRLGPPDTWADKSERFTSLSNTRACKQMRREDFDVAMAWAQEFLDRALELDARREKMQASLQEDALAEAARVAQERKRAQEEEEALRDAAEGESREDGGQGASGDEAAPGVEVRGVEGSDGDEAKEKGASSETGDPKKRPRKISLRPGDRIFYWHQTSIAGTLAARREATVLEVRSRKEAKERGLQLVVLDNQEILLDETVIQKFKKNEATGEWTDELEELGYPVRKHRLVAGRVEGLDPYRDEKMEAALARFRKEVVEYGAEDQMLDFVKGPGSGTGTVRSMVVDAAARGDHGDERSPRKPSSKAETPPKAETPAVAKHPKRAPSDSGASRTPRSRARTPRGTKGAEKKDTVATTPRISRTPRSRGGGGGKEAEQPRVKTPGVRARDVPESRRSARSGDAEEIAASYVRDTFRISRNRRGDVVPEGSGMGAGKRGDEDDKGGTSEEESTTETDAELAASNSAGKSKRAQIRSPEGKRKNPGMESENVGKVPCDTTTVKKGGGKRAKGSQAGSPKGAKRSGEEKLAEAGVAAELDKGFEKKKRASTGELARGEQVDGGGGGDKDGRR